MPLLNSRRKSTRRRSFRDQGRRSRLAFEPLEDRRLLSLVSHLTISTDPWEDFGLLERAIERAADLGRYTEEQLDATTDWAISFAAEPASSYIADSSYGEQSLTPFGSVETPTFEVLSFGADISWQSVVAQLEARDDVASFFPLVGLQRSKKFIPNDPFFSDQWHLQNTGQLGGTPGADANLVPAWDTALGTGVVIGIVDDGIEFTHPDLSPRYRADLSFDFLDNDNDPSPISFIEDFHGTAVAGVAAAAGNNGRGVSGAAPQAEIAALRLVSFPESNDAQEAATFRHERQQIDIYNNSWGPPDVGLTEAPGPLALQAFQAGVNLGRGGRGSIFVWAAGNGLEEDDNSNYDGYANSRYTIAVTAINDRGRQSFYAEPGASILVAAPSSGNNTDIVTTDLAGADGFNFVAGSADLDSFPDLDYTGTFGGTSSSVPLVSGIIALMLETKPDLGWREVQQILVETAVQNDPGDFDWVLNGAGRLVNHKYGFGAVDAAAAVAAAANWPTASPITSASTGRIPVGVAIPDDNTFGVRNTVTVPDDLSGIEWVEVVFDVNHSYGGDLRIVLTSPDGTRSVLAEPHGQPSEFNNWTFTTARHWGESTQGDWTLSVSDEVEVDTGIWNSWQLNFYTANREPVIAVNDPNFTRPNNSIDIAVLQNDVGNAIANTVTVITSPTNGTTVVNPATGSILYTPNAGFIGTDMFTYTFSDGVNTSNEATVTISVKNDPPVARDDDKYTIIVGNSISVNTAKGVLANDSDPEGDPITATLNVVPTNGSLTLNADGSFDYTADPGFFGTDQFTYVASDGLLDSAPATVSIRVNAPPQANPDSAVTDEDVAVKIDVLANDRDPDGLLDPATVTIVNDPTNGKIVDLNPATGAITYLPNPEYFGSDTLSYTVDDNDGVTSAIATVSITIRFVDDPAVIVDDVAATDVNTSTIISVLANDSDPDTMIPLDGIRFVVLPKHGDVVANSNGTVTYTPDFDFTGGDVFIYGIEDSLGVLSGTATVRIRVGDPVSISGFVFVDFDDDLLRELDEDDLPFEGVSVQIDKVDGPLLFSITVTTDVNGFYQLDEQTPGVDVVPAGVYEITQRHPTFMIDGGEVVGSGHDNPPSSPLVVADDRFSNVILDAGGAATGFNFAELGLRAEFLMEFLSGRLFLASSAGSGGFGGGIMSLGSLDLSKGPVLIAFDEGLAGNVRVTGKLSPVPGEARGSVKLELLDENADLISSSLSSGESVTLTASSAPGTPRFIRVSGTHTNVAVSIVGGVVDDEAPRADLADLSHITERNATSYTFSVRFSDNVAIDPSSIDSADIRVTGPNGFDAFAAAVSTVDVAAASPIEVDYTIAAPNGTWGFSDNGSYFLWLEPGQVSDINGHTAAATLLGEFGVSFEPLAPLARDDRFEVGEDGAISRSAAAGMLANDTVGDFGPIDELSIISPPAHGSLSYQLDGSFTYRPHPDFHGVDSFVYQTRVGSLAATSATVTFDVRSIEDAPQAVGETLFVDEDGRLEFGVDVLLDAGADWKYLADGSDQGEAWRQPSFDDALWSVGAGELGYGDGDETTVIEVDGDFGGEDKPITTYFRRSFFVRDVDSIRRLTLHLLRDDGATVYLNGVKIVRDNLSFNAKFDTLASTESSGADEQAFHTYAINPVRLIEGKNVLAVEVHQHTADSPDLSMDARLTAVRRGPSGLLSNDFDADGDPLRAILTTPPSHGTLTLLPGGSIVYVPDRDFVGSDSFRYHVSDGDRRSDDVSATIVVRPVNDSPVAADDSFSTEAGQTLTVEISTRSDAQDSPLVLIAAGEQWSFLDDGTDQQVAWIFSDFDDSAWSVGRGEFGYGDGDETTLIDYGPDPNNKYTTTYFRHTFIVDDVAAASRTLELRLLRDDGAAVYLNGVEIARQRLAADAAYDTFAVPKSRGEEERTFHVISVDPSLLVVGENTIAVEIHQHEPETSDMSFDLMLSRSSIGLLDNDGDVESEALSVRIVDSPTDGTVELHADGTFTYVPNPGFVGVDTFTYVTNDGTSDSNTATVTITVTAPSASADLTRDGFVDFDDLAVLLSNWNEFTSPASGNFVEPGSTPVDFNDLAALLAAWTGPEADAAPQAAVGSPGRASTSLSNSVDRDGHHATDDVFDRLGRETSSRRMRRLDAPAVSARRSPLHRLQASAVDRAHLGEHREDSFSSRSGRHIRRR